MCLEHKDCSHGVGNTCQEIYPDTEAKDQDADQDQERDGDYGSAQGPPLAPRHQGQGYENCDVRFITDQAQEYAP
jgi:hypothetical protein